MTAEQHSDISCGAMPDDANAGTEQRRRSVGMCPRSTALSGRSTRSASNVESNTAREIDSAVRELTTAAFETASAILRTYRRQLDTGAKLLLEKETLTGDELPLLEELKPAVAAASKVVV